MKAVDLVLKNGVYVAAGPEREVPIREVEARPKVKPPKPAIRRVQRPPVNPLDEFFEGVDLGREVLNDLFRRF